MLLNIFYLYAVVWSVILLLYGLGWSDLCIRLSAPIVLFVLFMILSSLALGYLMRKKFKFHKLSENPHKKPFVTIALVLFYIIEFICAKHVPLISVMTGNSYNAQGFFGIPVVHSWVTGFSILYAFYLAYLFFCFKKKGLIFEYLGIFSYFLLLFQRQNMLVVLLGGLWIGVASLDFKRLSRRNKILLCAGGVVAIIVLALLFGVVGNVRYGLWQWFDSSMICEVGAINDRWPPFVPKLMAWAYVYMISPLANLQCNYLAGIQAGLTFADYMWQLVPSCFANYIPHVSAVDVKLLHPALIVSTAFVAVYRIGGIGGMFAFYFIEIALIVAVVFATQKRIEHSCAYYMGLFYFFMMNFFDNPVAYEITAFMIMYPLLYELFALIVKEVRKLISKHKKPVAVTAETDAPTVIQEGAENDAPSMVQEAASNDEQPPAEDD